MFRAIPIYRLDRNGHGGGVFIYVNMLSRTVLYKDSPEFELLVISIVVSLSPDFLFYRPPTVYYCLLLCAILLFLYHPMF